MELISGDSFFLKAFMESKKNQRGDQSRKMEKIKWRKEVNVELFIVEKEE